MNKEDTNNNTQYFRSGRSVILLIPVFGLLLFAFLRGFNPNAVFSVFWIIMWVFIWGITLFVAFGIGYLIMDNQLFIKTGPFKTWKIPINKIDSINRSYNPISSPAASLRRMEIRFGGDSIFISPFNEQQFVKTLKFINPKIYVGIQFEKERENTLVRFLYWLL